jgi:hypothetical protein
MFIKYIDRVTESIGKKIEALSSWKFLFIVMAIQVLLHLPLLHLPPMGQHTWRQVAGLSQSRNFYEEDNSFFYPRIDTRIEKEDQGIIYKELPLIYWLIGQTYFLTGFHHANGRVVQLIISIALILGAFNFARSLKLNKTQAKWYVVFLTSSPYFFYYAVTVMPDFAALSWFLWGMALIIPKIEQEKWDWQFWLGILFITIAALSKSSWLFFGLPLAYLFLSRFWQDRRYSTLIVGIMAGALVLIISGIQYIHQMELAHLAPFERASESTFSYKSFPTDTRIILKVLNALFTNWLPQFYINYGAIPMFIAGIWYALLHKNHQTTIGGFWGAWLVSFFIYFLLFFISFDDDGEYYLTPILPLVAFISMSGAQKLLQFRYWRQVVFLLVCLIPFFMIGRVSHRWITHRQVPDSLLYRAQEVQKIIPEDKQVIVIGDASPIVFLYFIHRKGVAESADISEDRLRSLMKNGFQWVFSVKPPKDLPFIQKYINKTIRWEEFYILHLRELKINYTKGNK